MADERTPLSDDELAQLVDERTDDAHRMLAFRAVHEITVARRIVRALYHHMPDLPGQADLQAELERYAGELGAVKASPQV